MTSTNILDLFDGTADIYILEAIHCGAAPARRPNRRFLLLAAAISALLLLVGCAAFVLVQARSVAGPPDSPTYQAAVEWYNYEHPVEIMDIDDPGYSLKYGHPDVPDNYEYMYWCHTPEMLVKLREIAAKFNLKLLEENIGFQRWEIHVATEALGIHSFLREGVDAEIENLCGNIMAPYNFNMDYSLHIPALPPTTQIHVYTNFYHKDYMPAYSVSTVTNSSAPIDQWNYTNADGVSVQLNLAKDGTAAIFAETEAGYLYMRIENRPMGHSNWRIDKPSLELIADTLNLRLVPNAVDPEVIFPLQEEASIAARRANGTISDSFEAYLKSHYNPGYSYYDNMEYTFYDISGDGNAELFLGKDGAYEVCLTPKEDGTVQRTNFAPTYFCADRVYAGITHKENRSFYEFWQMDEAFETSTRIVSLMCIDGKWYQDFFLDLEELKGHPTISEAEALAIIAKYPPVEENPEWLPLADFPLSDGRTLGTYAASMDHTLTKEELHAKYAGYADKIVPFAAYYRIMDINSDGTDDLLISTDGIYYSSVYSYHDGYVEGMYHEDFMLYPGGKIGLDTVGSHGAYEEVSIQKYGFLAENWLFVPEDFVGLHRPTNTWLTKDANVTMTAEEAGGIIAKYPRTDQGMLPMSDLTA